MNKVLKFINDYLKNPNDPLSFSLILEEILVDLYEEMYKEDALLTEELNENFPEICAECEQGYEPNKYYQLVKQEVIRIEKVIGRKIFEYKWFATSQNEVVFFYSKIRRIWGYG